MQNQLWHLRIDTRGNTTKGIQDCRSSWPTWIPQTERRSPRKPADWRGTSKSEGTYCEVSTIRRKAMEIFMISWHLQVASVCLPWGPQPLVSTGIRPAPSSQQPRQPERWHDHQRNPLEIWSCRSAKRVEMAASPSHWWAAPPLTDTEIYTSTACEW